MGTGSECLRFFPPTSLFFQGAGLIIKKLPNSIFFAQIFLSGGKTFFILSSKKRRRGEKDNTPIHPLQIET